MARYIFILLFTISLPSLGQDSDKASGQSIMIHPGLNYHLQLNHIDIAPILNFELTENIHTGVGLNLLFYYRDLDHRKGEKAMGANIYARYFITPRIFMHGEYLYGTSPYLYPLLHEVRTIKHGTLLPGVGYKQPFSDNIDGYIFVLADLNHSEQSMYRNKILFKVGITL